MKILIFIDWFYPGYKAGGPITSNLNMIHALKKNIDFYVVSRNTDYSENIPYNNIEPNKWIEWEKNFHSYYISKEDLNRKTIQKIIKSIDYDSIYINGIYSWFFSILPLRIVRKSGRKVIVAPRGMLASSAIGVKSFKKNLFLFFANLISLYRNVTFHATNQEEFDNIRKRIKKLKKIFIAPNLSRIEDSGKSEKRNNNIPRFINVSRISPEKNNLFALEIMKRISVSTKLEYHLYGPVYNTAYWSKCKQVIDHINKNIQVQFHGPVENVKLNKTLSMADYLFFPSLGENYGHVIIESLAAGCPVIISDQTPWRNLEEKGIGWDIPLDQPEKFMEVIEYCCNMGQEEYSKMSKAAYEYAKSIITDPKNLKAYYKLFGIE